MRLRIISGELRGRLIDAPQSDLTRPTTERVRESIFNSLSNKIDFDGISVLDIYSGSGSLGFEAASRGAASVTFTEKNFVPGKVLAQNIEKLGLKDVCTIRKQAAIALVRTWAGEPFDLILADPPFFAYDVYDVVAVIKERKLIAPGGIMLIERSIQTKEKDVAAFGIEPYRQLGDTCLYEFGAEA
jgi:16S rRNA (guanine966-N2)-methyltransferase